MDNYIALGDSISISSYPSLDAGLGTQAKVGAADLTGLELLRLGHVHAMHNLACDGAMITDVYAQVMMLSPEVKSACNFITLTAHGNDISFAGMQFNRDKSASNYQETVNIIKNRYNVLVDFVLDKFPNSLLIINTSYDPTDGTGELPDCGKWTDIAKDWYSPMRREIGEYIREYSSYDRIRVCDLFDLFDGHGMAEAHKQRRWYYEDFMIEPGCNGAREISSAWMEIITSFIAENQEPQKRVSFSH